MVKMPTISILRKEQGKVMVPERRGIETVIHCKKESESGD